MTAMDRNEGAKPEVEKEDPVKEGEKAIEVQKKISGKPDEQVEKENKEDAQQWRNEG